MRYYTRFGLENCARAQASRPKKTVPNRHRRRRDTKDRSPFSLSYFLRLARLHRIQMQISKITGYVYFGHARVRSSRFISGAKENPFARLALRFGIQTLPLTHSARFKRSFRRKLAFGEKGEIHSVEIGSVVTNRRSPTTRKRERERESRQRRQRR